MILASPINFKWKRFVYAEDVEAFNNAMKQHEYRPLSNFF